MKKDCKTIPLGSLSYSNGSGKIDPYKFRLVGSGGDQLSSLSGLFPGVAKALETPPILISTYPSSLGVFEGVTVVDTYLREATFCQAVLLAVSEKQPVILVGQPLSLVNLIRQYLQKGFEFPSQAVLALGGYFCPVSLERYLREMLLPHCKEPQIIFGYGVAEVEFGCFLGMRESIDSPIIYHQSNSSVEMKQAEDSGELLLRRVGQADFINTGDLVSTCDDGSCIITQSSDRLCSATLELLESWSVDDWDRRTGYFGYLENGERVLQLRPHIVPVDKNEMDYFEHLRQFNCNWTDKPVWRA